MISNISQQINNVKYNTQNNKRPEKVSFCGKITDSAIAVNSEVNHVLPIVACALVGTALTVFYGHQGAFLPKDSDLLITSYIKKGLNSFSDKITTISGSLIKKMSQSFKKQNAKTKDGLKTLFNELKETFVPKFKKMCKGVGEDFLSLFKRS